MTIRWALLQLRYHKLLMVSAIALGILTILASVGLMSTSGYLISRAALRPPILDLTLAIVAVRFFGISRAAVRYGERLVSHDLTFRLLLRLRCWLYERLEPLIPSQRIAHHSGDLLSRLVSDVETLQNLYLRVASPVIVAGLVACAATGILWYLQPSAALLLLTGLFLCGVALPLTVLQLARKTSVRQITVRTALQRHLVDSVAGMEDMLALGVEQERQDEYSRMTNEFTRLQRRQALIGASHQFLGYMVTWVTVAGIMIDSIPTIQTGGFSELLLAAAAFGVLASFEAVQPMPAAYQYLEQATEASRRIHAMISRDADVLNPAKPIRAPVRPSFAFRNVSFTFPGGIGPALSDISFDLPFGSRIAILGPNGAGKSTIVQLLCRFFDPQKGAVLLGKRSLADYSIDDVRAQLAVVLQRPHIFNTSIRENLRLARPVATDRDLMSALEKAGLASFVQSLPQGLNAAPGSEGLTLSGGQRQRLALAQAFLKDAPVLVLDEATANLDLETEKEILNRIFQFTIGRTLVIITHRPENLSGMDKVLTLREGCLQEPIKRDVKGER